MLDLEPIKKRLAEATPGPWADDCFVGDDPYDDPDAAFVNIGDTRWSPNTIDIPSGLQRKSDASLIAHAPADIAALVHEVESLRADNKEIQDHYNILEDLNATKGVIIKDLRKDVAGMRGLLKEVEWSLGNCPSCGRSNKGSSNHLPNKHAKGCKLAQALGE
jgi:hypothetical protein